MIAKTGKDRPRWATGSVATPAGHVWRVASGWSRADRWGSIYSRVSAFRMTYSVKPGLYCVGAPTQDSDVFVSANYKLSFDILRRALGGFDAWILVLDTKGINVWCAAGKGTFGTRELVKRAREARLDAVVAHRRIILPQLGAVGVAAATVQRETGFRVLFGPVYAKDIPAYVRAGYKKTRQLSTVGFSLPERFVLTPLEIVPVMKKFPWFALVVLFIFGFQPSSWQYIPPFFVLGLLSVFAGAFLTPVLLPFIPFRSFAVKGWAVGAAVVFLATQLEPVFKPQDPFLLAASYVFFPALSSYIALQFTGSTTFTGMSGVKKELRIGLPAYACAAGLSLVFVVVFKAQEWGLL